MLLAKKVPIAAAISLLILLAHSCAREPEAPPKAVVQAAVGSVTILTGTEKKSPRAGDSIGEHDGIVTGKASSLDLLLGDTTVVRLYENTKGTLASLIGPVKKEGGFTLEAGKIFVIISKLRKGDSFNVITPTTTIAVRGTGFRVSADAGGASVAVLTGKAEVRARRDGVDTGDAAIVERNGSAEVSAAVAESIAAGRARVPVRPLNPAETQSLLAEFLAIKSGTIDRLPEPVRERFREDIEGAGGLRDKGLKEARERALRESIAAKQKAEQEALEKKKKEADDKKKKDDEARAKAIRNRKQPRPDRSGDVSGSK